MQSEMGSQAVLPSELIDRIREAPLRQARWEPRSRQPRLPRMRLAMLTRVEETHNESSCLTTRTSPESATPAMRTTALSQCTTGFR
jgi:hypothetical protein